MSLFHVHGVSNYPTHFINDHLVLIESGSILSCLDIETGEQHFILSLTEFNSVSCIASNPSHKIFAIALQSDTDSRIELYRFDDLESIELLHVFEDECSSVGYSHINISHNSEYMIAISNIPDLQIEFWSIEQKQKLAATNMQSNDTKYVSFSPTSHELFMTANNNSIVLWRVYFKFDQYFLTSTVHSLQQTRKITAITFGECGNEIIYCNNFGEMLIFDENNASNNEYTHIMKHKFDNPIATLLFTRFYYVIIQSKNTEIIQFISKNNLQIMYEYNIGSHIRHCLFSPNYKHLLIINKESQFLNCTIHKTLLLNDTEQITQNKTDLITKNEIFKFIQIEPNDGLSIVSLQTMDAILLHTPQTVTLIQLPHTNSNKNVQTFDFPICDVSTVQICHYSSEIDLIALGFSNGQFSLAYFNPSLMTLKLIFAQRLFKHPIKQIQFDMNGTLIACICQKETKIWFIEIGHNSQPTIIGFYELNYIPICCCWITDTYNNLKIIISFSHGFVSTYDAPEISDNETDSLLLDSYFVDCEVDFSLTKIVCDPNETCPDRLICLTEDNKLKAFLLDDDATVFPDDTFIFEEHCKRITSMHIQSDLLMTASMDGCILMRYLSEPTEIIAQLYAHNASYNGKGILCAQFVQSGAKVMSVGNDGSVISWQLSEDLQFENELLNMSECPLTKAYLIGCDEIQINHGKTDTFAEEMRSQRLNAKRKEFEPILNEIKSELSQLRQNYTQIIEKVNNASELEKLDSNELIVDNAQYKLLLSANASEKNKICKEIKYENVGRQLVMRRIKEQCYDAMSEKLQIVRGIQCSQSISTFPILSQNKSDLTINKKLQFLRKINICEQEWSTKTQDRVRIEFDARNAVKNAEINYIWDINEEKTAISAQLKHLLYNPMQLYTNFSKRIQINLLNTRIREVKHGFNGKVLQIFKLKTAEIERINEMVLEISDTEKELQIFDESKQNEYFGMDESEDKERIFKVSDTEINVEKVLTEKELFEMQRLESERKQRLKSANNDLTARALTEMMHNTLDSKDEVERLKDTLKKPLFMDKLDESKWSEAQKLAVLKYTQKREALVKAKEIRIKLLQTRLKSLKNDLNEILTKFDQKIADLYESRLRVLEDIYVHELMKIHLINDIIECEKFEAKLSAFEMELIRLKQDKEKVNLTHTQFHSKLSEYKQKLLDLCASDKYLEKQFKKEFGNHNCDYFDYLFKLFRGKKAGLPARNMNTSNHSNHTSERGHKMISDSNSDRSYQSLSKLNNAHSSRRSISMSRNSSSIPATNNQMSSELLLMHDLKEENECELENEENENDKSELKLEERQGLNPYFLKSENNNHKSDENNNISALVLLRNLIKPMDLNWKVWNKFLEFRKLKISKDSEIAALNEQIQSMECEVNALNENKEIIFESIIEINQALHALTEHKTDKYKLDCELFLRVKQGNIEIFELPVVTDLKQSILLNANIIRELNAQILVAGHEQIQELNEIKKFRRGINLLNWKNKILDLQFNYYTLLTTEYQLRRVTKKDQQIFGEMNDDNGRQSKTNKKKVLSEINSLEKKLLFTKNTFNAKMKEKKSLNQKYLSRIQQIRKLNSDLAKDIQKVRVDVVSEQDILEIRGVKSVKQERKESNKKKMDAIITRRKLIDLVQAQSGEIQFLRNELDRLRRKTFPSFSIAD